MHTYSQKSASIRPRTNPPKLSNLPIYLCKYKLCRHKRNVGGRRRDPSSCQRGGARGLRGARSCTPAWLCHHASSKNEFSKNAFFENCIFRKCIFRKCIFRKCIFSEKCLVCQVPDDKASRHEVKIGQTLADEARLIAARS